MKDYTVYSDQVGLHQRLFPTLDRHLASNYQLPIAKRDRQSFDVVRQWIGEHNRPIILDSGCGTGLSSQVLAKQHPDSLVVGIDKSEHRLQRSALFRQQTEAAVFAENLCLLRADVIHIWRLCDEHQIPIAKHYLLYPNPWPKAKHLQRRWHGHPVFPILCRISQRIELRSNWKIYVDEFAAACLHLGRTQQKHDQPEWPPVSRFEGKYLNHQQPVYRLQVD